MLPTLKMPYHKWVSSLFTSGLLHNFARVKVEEVHLTGGTFLHLVKFKNVCNVKIKVGIIVAVDKLTLKLAVPSILYLQLNRE